MIREYKIDDQVYVATNSRLFRKTQKNHSLDDLSFSDHYLYNGKVVYFHNQDLVEYPTHLKYTDIKTRESHSVSRNDFKTALLLQEVKRIK